MRGLLRNRTAVMVVAFILSVVSVQSWLGITKHVLSPHRNPVELFGLAFSVLFTALIAYGSSRFVWDRVVFASANIALVLAAIAAIASLAPTTASALQVAKSLLWTIGAVTSLILLVRGTESR